MGRGLLSMLRGKEAPAAPAAPTTEATPARPTPMMGRQRIARDAVQAVEAPPGGRAAVQEAALRPDAGLLAPAAPAAAPKARPVPPPKPAHLMGPPQKPLPTPPAAPAAPDLSKKPLPPTEWRKLKKETDAEKAPGLTDDAVDGVAALMYGQGDIKRGREVHANLMRPAVKDERWVPGAKPGDKADRGIDKSQGEARYKRGSGGSANRVDVIDYAQPINKEGATRGFFKPAIKPDKSGRYEVEGETDVPGFASRGTEDPRMAARAVATSRLAESLGLDVVAHEQHAQHGSERGNLSAAVPGRESMTNVFGLNSTRPSNAPLQKCLEKVEDGQRKQLMHQRINKFDLHKPGVQRGLNDLQWIDAISAQGDRHSGNVFIDDTTEKGSAHGIDNDVSWGTKGVRYEAGDMYVDEGYDPKDAMGRFNLGLPSQIDRRTADAILKMKAKNLDKVLNAGEKDEDRRLSPDEIAAAQVRLRAVKAHIKGMKKTGGIVDGWDEETYAKAMTDKTRLGTAGNYLARHQEMYDRGRKKPLLDGEQGETAEL